MYTRLNRGAGILLHISSLPSEYGIGDLGQEAYRFVDFLKSANQKYWQILPIGDIDEYNCPYKCYSAFAYNKYLISPEKLVEIKLLKKEDLKEYIIQEGNINYPMVKKVKNKILAMAYETYKKQEENSELYEKFQIFKEENNYWLDDYSLFKVAKEKFLTSNWNKWDKNIKNRKQDALLALKKEKKDELEKIKFSQFLFDMQWKELKSYANKQGISIIGDIPIYVHYESVDTWVNPKLFDLDENNNCKNVAGCPPDFFAKDGQVWGNPLYNWDEHKRDNFSWWIRRIKHSLKCYDYLRIDHFKGLEQYYAVPVETMKASDGEYRKAPGYEFFKALQEEIPNLPLIVEDLGDIDEKTEQLRDAFQLPGMRILQFGFDCKDALGYNPRFTPYNYIPNTVAYTGTHDNMTIKQWYEDSSTDKRAKKNFLDYINKTDETGSDFSCCKEMIRLLYSTVASVVIVPLQDVLELGGESRMNIPGAKKSNWEWRFLKNSLSKKHCDMLKKLTLIYGRD